MKLKLVFFSALITAVFTVVFAFSSMAQTDLEQDLGDSTSTTKGYKSSFNGTWMCHCPTYQQFDCYCAG